MKVVSLFSGCGGLDLGFKMAGCNIVWANDILPDACETYKKEIGDHIVCKDISEIDVRSIPEADVIIGGPPCQGFYTAVFTHEYLMMLALCLFGGTLK